MNEYGIREIQRGLSSAQAALSSARQRARESSARAAADAAEVDRWTVEVAGRAEALREAQGATTEAAS